MDVELQLFNCSEFYSSRSKLSCVAVIFGYISLILSFSFCLEVTLFLQEHNVYSFGYLVKVCFLHSKPYERDIYDHIRCSTALL